MNKKRISIFGLGYVGCVSMACLAKSGYSVIGVDTNISKVNLINQGVATIYEPGLDELLKMGFDRGLIEATNDAQDAIGRSDIILITVGTPSSSNGELDLSHIFSVAKDVATFIANSEKYKIITIRSTIKPGTCEEIIKVIEEISFKKSGIHFSVVSNPEFLREGTAIKDYENPPYILIGANDVRGSKDMANLYSNLEAEILTVPFQSAEIIKYINNSWHALKVAFGNEIGSICKSLGINSNEVMDIFLKDRILNISSNYLRPGYAFGGACLPKDLSALVALARSGGVQVPLLSNIHTSNNQHILRAINLIRRNPITNHLGFLGVSFKAGTDDVRNSPTLEIIRILIQDGYKISIIDQNVEKALMNKENSTTTREILGGIEGLLVSNPSKLIDEVDIIIVAKADPAFVPILMQSKNIPIIDLVGLARDNYTIENCTGLSW